MKKIKLIFTFIFIVGIALSSCEKEEEMNSVTSQTLKTKKQNNKLDGAIYSSQIVDCTISINGGEKQSGVSCFKRSSWEPCTGDHRCTVSTAINQQIQNHFSAQEIEDWGDGSIIPGDGIESINAHYDFYLFLYNEGILAEHPDDIIANYNAHNE